MPDRLTHSYRPGKPEELFPALVTQLENAGVRYEFRPAVYEVKIPWPYCCGSLYLRTDVDWHFCFSRDRCPVDSMEFAKVLAAILKGRP